MKYKSLYEGFTKKVRSRVDIIAANAAASAMREMKAGKSKKAALDAFNVEMRSLHDYVEEQTESIGREMLHNQTLSEMMEDITEAETSPSIAGSTLRVDPGSLQAAQGAGRTGFRPDPGAPRKARDTGFSDTSKNQQQLTAYSSNELPTGDPMADRDREAAFRGGEVIGAGPEVTLARSAEGKPYGSVSVAPGQAKAYSQNQNSVLQWGRDILNGKNTVSPGIEQEVRKLMGNYDTFKNDKSPTAAATRERLVAQISGLQARSTQDKQDPASDPQQLTPDDFRGPNPRSRKGQASLDAVPGSPNGGAGQLPGEAQTTEFERIRQGLGMRADLDDVKKTANQQSIERLKKAFGSSDDLFTTFVLDALQNRLTSLTVDDQREFRAHLFRQRRDYQKPYLNDEERDKIAKDTFLSLAAFGLLDISRRKDAESPAPDPQLNPQSGGASRFGDNFFDYVMGDMPELQLGSEPPGELSAGSEPSDMEKSTASLLNKAYSDKKSRKDTAKSRLERPDTRSKRSQAKTNADTDAKSSTGTTTKSKSAKSSSDSRVANFSKAARKSRARAGGTESDLNATDLVDASAKASDGAGSRSRGDNDRRDLSNAIGELKRKIRRLAKQRKDSDDERVKERLTLEIERLQTALEKMAISLEDS